MPYIEDLSPWTGFGQNTGKQLIAIGWIDNSHPFTQASVDPVIIANLEQLPRPAPVSIAFLGICECAFCDKTASDISFVIPAAGFLYVYPALLLHYITEHGYSPPSAFCEAVLNCPPLNSPEYVDAIEQNCSATIFRSIHNRR